MTCTWRTAEHLTVVQGEEAPLKEEHAQRQSQLHAK